MNRQDFWRWILLCLVLTGLSACALYHSRPLPQQPDLQPQLAPVRVDLGRIHLPGLKPHPFDPAKGLDATDVAILAVINNPALRTTRAQAHAGEAQAFVAGMLPGPQLSYSLDHPQGQAPLYVNGYSAGIAYDLSVLVEHSAASAAARAGARQVDLDLLWQEWQVAQQARLQYLDCLNNRRKLELLENLQQGMQSRYEAEQHAYAT
ncbi:MAG: TolC family protein, partial [Gammaproteobacteria bacterium]|nr:TolC family protein [Gammaproteobacteria bacterium]